MFGDVVDGEDLGEFFDRGARFGVLLKQFAYRVGDLPAPAVADRDVDLHAGAALGPQGRGGQPRRGFGGQHVKGAHDPHPPRRGRVGELVHHSGDDLHQRAELFGAAVEIVGGQQPQRDDLDLGLFAPAEQFDDLAGTHAMPMGGVQAGVLGPSAIAVQDDPDVPRMLDSVELPAQPPLIDVVDEFFQPNLERHAS